MSKVDWSLAPEGATHFFFGDARHSAHWSKTGFFCVEGFEGSGWREDLSPLDISRFVERPQPEPKPWSGPEDGLPPVGTVCRVVKKDGAMAPLDTECEVIAHYKNGHNILAAFKFGKDYSMHVCSATKDCFGPEKTPEQLAAEERERAIVEMRAIFTKGASEFVGGLAALYDAGFKREVK